MNVRDPHDLGNYLKSGSYTRYIPDIYQIYTRYSLFLVQFGSKSSLTARVDRSESRPGRSGPPEVPPADDTHRVVSNMAMDKKKHLKTIDYKNSSLI